MCYSRFAALLAGCVAVGGFACSEEPAKTHHRRAIELYKNGDFAKAAEEYDQVYALDPTLEERVQKKGAQAWSKAGQFDKAAAILERLANSKIGPEKVTAYREVALFYKESANDLNTSEKWLTKALELDPKDDQSMLWLAEIASIRGGARVQTAPAVPEQLDAALKRYDDVIVLKPNNPSPYVNKRIAYVKYLGYLQKSKDDALAAAEASKKDKVAAANFRDTADAFNTKLEAMKAASEENNKKLGAVLTAAKAASTAADAGS